MTLCANGLGSAVWQMSSRVCSAAPFVDDQVVVGRYDAGDRDAAGKEMVCDFLFNGE